MKTNKLKLTHIIIIIIGIIFISLSAFHKNIWFDETYSTALATHSFKEIWQIGGNDVHPILYYWVLHILYLIFGRNLIIYRLFSVLCISLLGILGYTHIRKDFGEKIGCVFSYFSYFLPVMCIYAVEIRMYALAILLAVLMAIYAYRITKENTKKNWIIFSICSLALSYTHYYGLMTAGITNLLLFAFALKKRKEDKSYLKNFIIQAIIEVILYVPWLVYFALQLKQVGEDFWIIVSFPRTLIEVLNFQYKGFTENDFSYTFSHIITFIFAIFLYIYIGHIIYKEIKQKNDIKPGILAITIYIGVILAALIISIFVPILYCRYIFVITGFLIFTLSYFLIKEKRKVITYIIFALITMMAIFNNYQLIKDNYADSNLKQVKYIADEISQDDIIIYSNISESMMVTYFPENKQYFLNLEHWNNIEKAYEAYLPQMKTVEDWDFIKDFKGRIWIVESGDSILYKEIENARVLLDSKEFCTAYHEYYYNIMLVEKE